MEEVDEIVIHTLRQIGCDLEDVSSLREFTTEIVIEGVVRCLKLINPSLELSHHVPPSMSARYRVGSALASACSELGYKGEIGYQTFLYSNESDLRKVFLFLVEKLPKESEKVLDEPLGKSALILREIALHLGECLTKPWLPRYCRSRASDRKHSILLDSFPASNKPFQTVPIFIPACTKVSNEKAGSAVTQYSNKYLPFLHKQAIANTTLICSILERNTLNFVRQFKWENEWGNEHLPTKFTKQEIRLQKSEKVKQLLSDYIAQTTQPKKSGYDGTLDEILRKTFRGREKLVKASRFAHAVDLQFATNKEVAEPPGAQVIEKGVDTQEEKQKKREEEIAELQNKLDSVSAKLNQIEVQSKKYEVSLHQITEMINKEQEKIDDLKESYRVKECTLSLLPDAENNMEKLQALIDASSQRLISLANQWEQHRVPLIDQYRELKDACSQRLNETQKKLEEIKELREKIRETGIEARLKDETYKQLTSAYEKLTKDVSRSAYTRRILEIVANIKKQKAEIDKVLLDTRNIQKEINRLSGKLERTFTVTDELIFRDAKKDESVRRAYKSLAALHENCSQLVQIVEDTGSIVREIREIEDQIEQENQKKVAATLERITLDYKQMQQENATLLVQLKMS